MLFGNTIKAVVALTASLQIAVSSPIPDAEIEARQSIPKRIFPFWIVPLDKSNPSKVYGTQYGSTFQFDRAAGLEQFTAYGFYIPANFANTCRLTFLAPAPTATSGAVSRGVYPNVYDPLWTVKVGPQTYPLDVYKLTGLNPSTASWNNKPARDGASKGTLQVNVKPGTAASTGGSILLSPCPSAQNVYYEYVTNWGAEKASLQYTELNFGNGYDTGAVIEFVS